MLTAQGVAPLAAVMAWGMLMAVLAWCLIERQRSRVADRARLA